MTDAGHDAEALLRALDHLTIGVACFALDGRLLHQTTALRSLSASTEEADRLLAEAREFALTMADRHHAWTDAADFAVGDGVRTRDRRHHLGASLVPAGRLDAQPALLVIIRRAVAARAADPGAGAGKPHRLTPREVDVARLLAAGESNQQIATQLRVSVHTVRHHTERVLRKLGVQRRAAVGPVLRG